MILNELTFKAIINRNLVNIIILVEIKSFSNLKKLLLDNLITRR